MSGLIWKDILVMRKTLRTYGLLLLFYLVMVVIDFIPLNMVVAIMEVIVMILPISAFSYDEMAKWERYAAVLPIGMRAVVGARYLFTLGIAGIAAAFGFAASAVMSVLGTGMAAEGVVTVLVSLAMGLIIVDLLLPLCYKLGPERARPYMYLVIFVPAIVLFAGARLGMLDSLGSRMEQMSDGAVLGLFALLPLAGLVGLGVSWLISCRIMERKEF